MVVTVIFSTDLEVENFEWGVSFTFKLDLYLY